MENLQRDIDIAANELAMVLPMIGVDEDVLRLQTPNGISIGTVLELVSVVTASQLILTTISHWLNQ